MLRHILHIKPAGIDPILIGQQPIGSELLASDFGRCGRFGRKDIRISDDSDFMLHIGNYKH